jgi:hypothetical protein
MRLIVREPIRKNLMLARIIGTQHGKQSRIEVGEGIEILAVHILDPSAILLGMPTVANADEQRRRHVENTQPEGTNQLAVRSGMWDQLAKRITASELPQRKRLTMLRRQRRWQQRLNQQRRKQQNPQERRQAAESCRSWAQEPRFCCRKHSALVQRQKHLELVWSSSIDTPEILNDKRPSGLPPRCRDRF